MLVHGATKMLKIMQAYCARWIEVDRGRLRWTEVD